MTKSAPPVIEELKINFVGLSPEMEPTLKRLLEHIISVAAKEIDLTGLDEITFSGDYAQSLLDLDRGYDTDFKLAPSNDHGIGVAMSPSVFRDGILKTHIVISAQAFFSMMDAERDDMIINHNSS